MIMITGKVNYNSILKAFVISAWASCISLFVVSCGNTTTPTTTVVVNETKEVKKEIIAKIPQKDTTKTLVVNSNSNSNKKSKEELALVTPPADDNGGMTDDVTIENVENMTEKLDASTQALTGNK